MQARQPFKSSYAYIMTALTAANHQFSHDAVLTQNRALLSRVTAIDSVFSQEFKKFSSYMDNIKAEVKKVENGLTLLGKIAATKTKPNPTKEDQALLANMEMTRQKFSDDAAKLNNESYNLNSTAGNGIVQMYRDIAAQITACKNDLRKSPKADLKQNLSDITFKISKMKSLIEQYSELTKPVLISSRALSDKIISEAKRTSPESAAQLSANQNLPF